MYSFRLKKELRKDWKIRDLFFPLFVANNIKIINFLGIFEFWLAHAFSRKRNAAEELTSHCDWPGQCPCSYRGRQRGCRHTAAWGRCPRHCAATGTARSASSHDCRCQKSPEMQESKLNKNSFLDNWYAFYFWAYMVDDNNGIISYVEGK